MFVGDSVVMALTMENWNHSILYRLGFKHNYEQIEVKMIGVGLMSCAFFDFGQGNMLFKGVMN